MTLYCSWELSASSVVWAQILAGILFSKNCSGKEFGSCWKSGHVYFQIHQFFVYAGKKQIYNWSSIKVLYINIL
jgi:hypothetical protein